MFFFGQDPLSLIGIAIALIVGITCHEASHALAADMLGDHRPRALGRLSLNPLRHLDPIGSLFFLVAGFGWGRPVLVNAAAMRGGRRSMAWVSSAGVAANLVVAVGVAVLVRLGVLLGLPGPVVTVLWVIVFYNVLLGFFNILPIPPLDGYNFVLALLPFQQALQVQRYAQWGVLVLLALIVLSQAAPGGGPLGLVFDAVGLVVGFLTGA